MRRKPLHSRKAALTLWYPLLPTDTAAKVQAAKDKASQANTTANDVLARIKDLNQNLLGLKSNYSKLADDVAKTNAVVKDPTKSSKIFILFVCFFPSSSQKIFFPVAMMWSIAHQYSFCYNSIHDLTRVHCCNRDLLYSLHIIIQALKIEKALNLKDCCW